MDNLHSFGIENGSCVAYTPQSFNDGFNHVNKLFVMNFNIRSFNKNFDEFSTYISQLKFLPDVIIITETWFTGVNFGKISGYKGFHCTRSMERIGGGVSVYVSNSMTAKTVMLDCESLPDIEYIRLKVLHPNYGSIEVLAVYRPPNATFLQSFFTKIDELLNNISTSEKQILIGDLNICGISPVRSTTEFVDICRSYCLMPHVYVPTRPNENGIDSQIDHIWSNFGVNFRAGVFENVGISDHLINFVLLPMNLERRKSKIKFRDHSEQNIKDLIDKLKNFSLFLPLLSANSDYNTKFEIFFNEMDRIYKNCCPLKIKEVSENSCKKPWINGELLLKIKRKHYLFSCYKRGAISKREYKSFETHVRKELNKLKRDYFLNKFNNCAGNSKETWKLANSISCNYRNGNNSSLAIMQEGVLQTDEGEITNIFNEYFARVGINLAENIMLTPLILQVTWEPGKMTIFIFSMQMRTKFPKLFMPSKIRKQPSITSHLSFLKKLVMLYLHCLPSCLMIVFFMEFFLTC